MRPDDVGFAAYEVLHEVLVDVAVKVEDGLRLPLIGIQTRRYRFGTIIVTLRQWITFTRRGIRKGGEGEKRETKREWGPCVENQRAFFFFSEKTAFFSFFLNLEWP